MFIPVTDDLRIRKLDKWNWVIETQLVKGKRSKEAGEAYWKVVAYYPSIKLAALAALKVATNEETVTSLDNVIQTIDRAEQNILSALRTASALQQGG